MSVPVLCKMYRVQRFSPPLVVASGAKELYMYGVVEPKSEQSESTLEWGKKGIAAARVRGHGV